MSELRIALSQINLTVGDIDGNATKIASSLDRARESRVDVVLFPELTLTGYPPEDLLLKPRFVTAARAALQGLLPLTRGLTAVVGFPDRQDDLYNAAAVLHDGRVAGVYHKRGDEVEAGESAPRFAPMPGLAGRPARPDVLSYGETFRAAREKGR